MDGMLNDYFWGNGEAGSVNGVEGLGDLQHEESVKKGNVSQQLRLKPVKRLGVTISKGHKIHELMLNLQKEEAKHSRYVHYTLIMFQISTSYPT